MTKPSSKGEEQPMVRHMFSTQQKPANTGVRPEETSSDARMNYLARGQADGYAIEDWQQAERELQARQP